MAIEQNPHIKGLLVILTPFGGDVEAGLAIAEMIESLPKPRFHWCWVAGIRSWRIATAADYSFIAATATMTIHPLRLSGMLIGVPRPMSTWRRCRTVINFITGHSRIKKKGCGN